MKKYILIILLGLLSLNVLAQQKKKANQPKKNCADIQRQARRLYDQGNIEEAIKTLNLCLENKERYNGSESGTKADIYWLASQIYLLKKDSEKAKDAYKKMLSYRPYYQPTEADMQDAQLIREQVWVLPRLSMSFRLGLANTTVNIIRPHKVLTSGNKAKEVKKVYSDFNLGTKIGVGGRLRLSERLEIYTGLEIWGQTYSYSYQGQLDKVNYEGTVEYDVDANGELISFLDTITQEEYSLEYSYDHKQSMTHVAVPISLKYSFVKSEAFMPYIEAGVYAGFLLTANRLIKFKELDRYTITNIETGVATEQSYLLDDVFDSDTKAMFVKGAFGYTLGIGADITIRKKLYFGIGAKYQANIFNHTKQSVRFSYEDLLYSFYDLQDDFSLNNLSINAHWHIPLAFKAYDKKRLSRR